MPDVEPLMQTHTTKRSTRQSAPTSAEGHHRMALARISGQQKGVPNLTGMSHLSFTVADMESTKWFWTEVIGCQVVMEESDFCLCVEPSTKLPISFKDHDGTVSGSFNETNVGLDHLALSVADTAELQAWLAWLDQHDVPHSDITETDLGHHLNLRAPDNIAIELFTVKDDAADAIGLRD